MMNVTANESNVKLKTVKDDLKVDILKENHHKNDIKINGLLNGASKDIGPIIKKMGTKDPKIYGDSDLLKKGEKLNSVKISNDVSENLSIVGDKINKGLNSDDIIKRVHSNKFDSNDNLMQVEKILPNVSCPDIDITEHLTCLSCTDDLFLPNIGNVDLNNSHSSLDTNCALTTTELSTSEYDEALKRNNENSECGSSPTDKLYCAKSKSPNELSIEYVQYENELQMPLIMKIIQKDLSEPYSIYTYRYFIHNWPKLCFLAMDNEKCVGAIVCKLDYHRKIFKRGYIAMLAVDKDYRKQGIGSTLVKKAIQEMIIGDADEVVLETEVTNKPALQLYEALGFVRDKRLFRYYLNGVDALRLKLWLR
ncbi:hypothetical protein WA026_001769 [Henosepilachna vigintioctopunctata]|uniref:N-terminal methionine N(alpha)-acetyltransferase NatC n=1 Tax=Henosepilachna vigintioctopunctata TaxID=420089 RepID=A0AAW1UST1_9CUCU